MTTEFLQYLFTIPAASNDLHSILTPLIGVIAVIWLGNAVIGIGMYLLGAEAILDARALIRACPQHVRSRCEVRKAQPATTEPGNVAAKITYLDHYRCGNRASGTPQHGDALRPGSDDDHPT